MIGDLIVFPNNRYVVYISYEYRYRYQINYINLVSFFLILLVCSGYISLDVISSCSSGLQLSYKKKHLNAKVLVFSSQTQATPEYGLLWLD